jgi:hypothetical protein
MLAKEKALNICCQCLEPFETWPRVEDYSIDGVVDLNLVDETEFCSQKCYDEWRSDNRAELCN